MNIEQLVPQACAVEFDEVLRGLRDAPRVRSEPFNASRVDFSDALSHAIFHHPRSRAFPELLAAAFWLRRAAVSRLADRFAALEVAGSVRAPRGLVFHVPPANVDTLFIYPLMASFLVGNRNLVRISREHVTEQVTLLCEALRALLGDRRFAAFSDELVVISYGHEPEPTAAASMEADVRLIWGGDETIELLRAVPVGPSARDLTFGDRFSFAMIRPAAVLNTDEQGRRRLAEQLFNDVYWFDQQGCASPRLVIWVGGRGEADAAGEVLRAQLAAVVADKHYSLEPATAIAKLTFMYGALIDRRVENVHQVGNELLVLSLRDLDGFDRTHPGAGMLFEARIDALSDLLPFVNRKDQTLTAHGFSAEELKALARSLHGRGIDRIVPFGEALSFGTFWDGYDLLAELTRVIDVRSPASNLAPIT